MVERRAFSVSGWLMAPVEMVLFGAVVAMVVSAIASESAALGITAGLAVVALAVIASGFGINPPTSRGWSRSSAGTSAPSIEPGSGGPLPSRHESA